MSQAETKIMQAIQEAVTRDGRAKIRRNVIGQGITDYGSRVTFGMGDGSADLLGMLRGSGRVLALEVKTFAPGSRQNKDQLAWAASIRRAGGFVAVARSPAEALAAVTRALAGLSE